MAELQGLTTAHLRRQAGISNPPGWDEYGASRVDLRARSSPRNCADPRGEAGLSPATFQRAWVRATHRWRPHRVVGGASIAKRR